MSCDNACASCGNPMIGMCQRCSQCSRCCTCHGRDELATHTMRATERVREACRTANTAWLAKVSVPRCD